MNKIKLAIADDHSKLRKLIVLNLSLYDQLEVVLEAENGKILIDKLPNTDVDIVLLDIRMPVMDGRDTIICLKKNYPALKVIMLSTMNEDYYNEKFKKLGANSFVCKTDGFNHLINTIVEVNHRDENGFFVIEKS